ncbi:MAG TPA: hypothetical protein VKR82_04540 [Candidatus Acidoferrales bacterium]|nr:hypothetical protein [Candidatus Acidoferrales bacterium]
MFNLALQLFEKPAFHFPYLAAAKASDVDVVPWAMALVEVLLPVDVKKVKLVNQAELLEHVEGAIHGDAVDAGVNLLRAFEDGACVQMALGVVHHLQQNTPLAGKADAAFGERRLKTSGGQMGIQAFAAGNTMSP